MLSVHCPKNRTIIRRMLTEVMDIVWQPQVGKLRMKKSTAVGTELIRDPPRGSSESPHTPDFDLDAFTGNVTQQ